MVCIDKIIASESSTIVHFHLLQHRWLKRPVRVTRCTFFSPTVGDARAHSTTDNWDRVIAVVAILRRIVMLLQMRFRWRMVGVHCVVGEEVGI